MVYNEWSNNGGARGWGGGRGGGRGRGRGNRGNGRGSAGRGWGNETRGRGYQSQSRGRGYQGNKPHYGRLSESRGRGFVGNERGFENVTSRADETFHKEKEQLPKRPPADDSHAGGGNERGIGNLSAWAASFYKEKEPLPNGPPGDDSIDEEYYRQDYEDYSPYPDEDTSTHTYTGNERAKR